MNIATEIWRHFMKQTVHKITAAVLTAAVLISAVAASSLGSFLRQNSLELSDTSMLTHGQLANSAVTGGRQTENIVEYYPRSPSISAAFSPL